MRRCVVRDIFYSESCTEMKNTDRYPGDVSLLVQQRRDHVWLNIQIADSNSIDCLFYALLAASVGWLYSFPPPPTVYTGLNSWTYLFPVAAAPRRSKGVTEGDETASGRQLCHIDFPARIRVLPTSNINRPRVAIVKVHLKKHASNQTQSIASRSNVTNAEDVLLRY